MTRKHKKPPRHIVHHREFMMLRALESVIDGTAYPSYMTMRAKKLKEVKR